MAKNKINITYLDVAVLKPSEYNPRTWDDVLLAKLTDSISRFGFVDPLIVNGAHSRKNIIIGGHFRYEVARKLKIKKIPVVYVNITDIEKEKELNLRLNRNIGQWDWETYKNLLLDHQLIITQRST